MINLINNLTRKTLNYISILIFMLFIISSVFAKHIDENTARQVGLTLFSNQKNFNTLRNSVRLDLVYKAISSSIAPNVKNQQTTYFYVFNVDEIGFVIIAGDDNVTPILGYSDEGVFRSENIPLSVQKWLEEYKSQINYIIENNILASEDIMNEWQEYLNISKGDSRSLSSSVQPLIKTKWNQGQYYNTLCPFDNQYNQRTVTGCVATAMAQILKYWNYPNMGSGFHSYNHQKYGTLSANFGNTVYQWTSMPNTVVGSNNAVATLMYHCGVSVDMDYDVSSQGGSGAFVISSKSSKQHCSEYAFKTYFGYNTNLQGLQRENYNQTQWVNLLKNELNENRPILYAGFGSGGGHCFVADGYDNNDLFHFNWGWGGDYDGYFQINALNPIGTGTGGGNGGYNSGHQAIINIEPPANKLTPDLRLYNYVTPTPPNVKLGNPIVLTTNISNNGSNLFNGEICAALFDENNDFVEYIQILNNISLPSGHKFTNGLTFQNNTLSQEVYPGMYKVGIYFRPTNGNWALVSNNGNYKNWVDISINATAQNEDFIELFSPLTVTPNIFIQGKSASVSVNVVNKGTNYFKGKYYADLVSLDGMENQDFSPIYVEENGLAPGYRYTNPLVFNISSINVPPGTYWLRLQYSVEDEDSGLTISSLAGSSDFPNPIKVIVKAPPLLPDQYENNNAISQSYTLPLSFSDNKSSRTTIGSNFHIGTDNDFYKLNLPTGFTYSIKARLHDSDNSNNETQYTADALFSYSTNGDSWSNAFDYIIPENINIQNGGTVYFHVAPYFEGISGTYLLDLAIERSQYVSCQVPTGLKAISIGYSHAKLEWNQDEKATGFQVKYRTNSNNWTESSVLYSEKVIIGNLIPNSQYEIQVRSQCNSSILSDWSSPLFIRTEGEGDPYCKSYGLSWDDYISQFTLGDINNVSVNGYGYTNFEQLIANLEKSKTYEIKLKPFNSTNPKNMNWKVWIDLNKNNSFDDTGELVYSSQPNSIGEVSGSINIPSNAVSGITRLRVAMSESEIMGSCQINGMKDVEDYSVNIKEKNSFLDVTDNEIFIQSKSSSFAITVQTNCDWQIKNVPFWINVSSMSGSGSKVIGLDFLENSSTQTRIALLEVHGCDDMKEIITIIQYGCIAPSVPSIIASKSSICSGETSILTVKNPCNDCAYIWSNNSNGTSIGVNQGGVYTVTAKNVCTSVLSNEIEVTSKQLPAKPITSLTGTIKLCDGETKTISVANVCVGCNIQWSTGESTNSIELKETGTYFATLINDCGLSEKSDNIFVEQETYIPPIIVNNLCYLAGPSGNTSYQWFLNGLEIPNANLQFYIASQNGYYTLKSKRTDNCIGISEPIFISGCISSIENEPSQEILVSPNPFRDELIIRMPSYLSRMVRSNLFSITGELIDSQNSEDGLLRYETKNLSSGIYLIKLIIHDKIMCFRVLKI